MVTDPSHSTVLDILGIILTILAMLLTVAFVFAPFILAAFYTKNRRMWLWWHRNGRKSTLLISLIVTALRTPQILSVTGSRYGDEYIFFLLSSPDLLLAFKLSYIAHSMGLASLGREWTIEVIALELLSAFVLFSLLKASKTYFAKRAYEIE